MTFYTATGKISSNIFNLKVAINTQPWLFTPIIQSDLLKMWLKDRKYLHFNSWILTDLLNESKTELSELTAVKRKSMSNALVLGPARGNFPSEILIETIAETCVRQYIVEPFSEIR